MPTPIILVSGKAGSGKDTAAAHIAKTFNAATLAQADPMKRFVKDLMGFSTEALWGPSSERNKVIPVDALKIPLNEEFDFIANKMLLAVFETGQTTESPKGRKLRDWFNRYVMQKIDANKGISARTVLQTLGTEWGRQVAPKMWIEKALRDARALVEGGVSYTREAGLVQDPGQAFDYAVITDGRFRNEVLGVTFAGGVALHVIRPGQEELKGAAGQHRSEKELDGIPDHFYTDSIMNDSTLEVLFERVDDAMAVHFGDVRSRG